jgi:hypothetical protein
VSCQCSPQVRPPGRPVQADAEQRRDRIPDLDQVRLLFLACPLALFENGCWSEVSEAFGLFAISDRTCS